MPQCEETFKKTIVAIDDTPENLQLIVDILKDRYRVKTFKDPKKALEYLFSNTCVDLILLDIMMPEMDGMEVTQIVRREFPAPKCHMPILALTASANPVDHDRCLASGMNDVLHKPLDEPQLISKISNVLAVQASWGAP